MDQLVNVLLVKIKYISLQRDLDFGQGLERCDIYSLGRYKLYSLSRYSMYFLERYGLYSSGRLGTVFTGHV